MYNSYTHTSTISTFNYILTNANTTYTWLVGMHKALKDFLLRLSFIFSLTRITRVRAYKYARFLSKKWINIRHIYTHTLPSFYGSLYLTCPALTSAKRLEHNARLYSSDLTGISSEGRSGERHSRRLIILISCFSDHFLRWSERARRRSDPIRMVRASPTIYTFALDYRFAGFFYKVYDLVVP